MITPLHPVAVLTGDLIGSTGHSPEWTTQALDRIKTCAQEIRAWDDADDPRFTRYRGDGWQIVLSEPYRALRAALYIQASLKSVQSGARSRIAIGMGEIDDLPVGDLSNASGPAFIASGQALDDMARDRELVIAARESAYLHEGIAVLLDREVQDWSREQAEAMMHFLPPSTPTLKDLADALGISPQAIHSRLKSAHWREVVQAVTHWEAHEESQND